MDMLLTVSLYRFASKPKRPVGHYFFVVTMSFTVMMNKWDVVLHMLSDYMQSPIKEFAPFSYVTLY